MLIGMPFLCISQETDPLTVSFVKDQIIQKTGELSFNVVKITNNTSYPKNIQTVLNLPNGWAKFSNAFGDTIIPPNTQIALPFRFRTSPKSRSEIEHKVNFIAFDKERRSTVEASFSVILDAYHSWDIIIPEKRVYFYPGIDIAQLEVQIVNSGNTTEIINIDITPDRNLILTGVEGNSISREITLPPSSEEIIRLEAQYINSDSRVFDINKVRIIANSDEKKIYRSVILEKYSDEYAPFEVDRTLAHETEAGFRSFARTSEIKPFVRARGNHTFKNDSEFRYNFTYYDILESENIISNSYYNFLYSWDEFKAGIGAFSSMLGRNLYSRNCIMVSNVFSVDETSSIEGYASYGLIDPKANIAAAYHKSTDRFELKGSLAYDIDNFHNRNTASAVLHTGRFKVIKNHELRLSLYGYNENYDVKNPYSLAGYAWDINYYGKITSDFEIHFTNNYGSPDIPGPQMGLTNFYTKLKFSPGEGKNYVTLSYINSSRDYYFHDVDGVKLPDIYLKDNYASFFFHNNSFKKVRWYVGPSVEFYNSSHPLPQNKRRKYDVDKYRMEFKGNFGHNLMVNVKYGLGIMNIEIENRLEERVHDFHVLANYSNNGYGIRAAYDYGPMVNMGLYQYALDAGNHSISISPYVLKSYFKGRVGLSLFTNYTYRFDLEYGSLNINPKVETYLYKDWYAVVGGTYTYTQQDYGELRIKNSFYYAEFSIKKRWGRSDYYKWRKDLRRMKLQLFKDKNGNGKMDRGEEGIPNVKVRIELTNTADHRSRENFPVDITLMSNERGIVYFTRIPKGFYKVTIIPLIDLQEYFYVDNSRSNIELNKNANMVIPFQKADKIVGRVELKRNKFVTEDDEKIGMSNIKVTAYNEVGDSYSTFTLGDGSFTIYAPGNHVYHVRIKNVFGSDFVIMNNDSRRLLTDSVSQPVVIRVVEKSRKINFKKAKRTKPDAPDVQKIKVLPGKIYENSSEKPVDVNSIPDFKINTSAVAIKELQPDKYYLSSGQTKNLEDAHRIIKVLDEQGVKAEIRTFGDPAQYIIIVDEFEKLGNARDRLKRYWNSGIRTVSIYHVKNKRLDKVID